MTNHSVGHAAEDQAAEYLKGLGYKVLDMNWKTRYCEIDIVAQKDKVVWLVEVKSRRSALQGFGYEYVTKKKLEQMRFAAKMWVQTHKWTGDFRLAVVSVDGDQIQLIEDID